MTKDPDEIFDIESIAARNIAEAKLRAKAFSLALDLAKWHGNGQRPAKDIAKLANALHAWFHTGEFIGNG